MGAGPGSGTGTGGGGGGGGSGSGSGKTPTLPPYSLGTAITLVDVPVLPVEAPSTVVNAAPLVKIIYIDSYTPIVAATNQANPFGIQSWKDFVNLCKKYPGQVVTAGMNANGIATAVTLFVMNSLGISFLYSSGYTADAVFDVDGKSFVTNVTLYWGLPSTVLFDSRFVPLAVSSPAPLSIAPSVPTMLSLGIPYVDGIYHGIAMPLAASADLCSKISNGMLQLHTMSSYQQMLTAQGIVANPVPYDLNGTAVSTFLTTNLARYTSLFYPTPSVAPVIAQLANVPAGALYAMQAGAALGIVLTLITAVVLFSYRSHPVMLAASIPFCFVMLLGLIVGFAALIILTLLDNTWSGFSNDSFSQLCRAFPFVFGAGFNLIFTPLFLKTQRLATIFYNTDLTSARMITNASIVRQVTALLLIEMAFQVAWVVSDPLNFSRYDVDDATFVMTCQCNHLWVWIGVMIAAKAVLLIFGLTLAFKTRNLESQFNESKATGFCLYNIFLCAAIFLPIVFTIRSILLLHYFFMTGGLLLSLSVTLGAMFGPKLYLSITLSAKDAHAQFAYKRSSKKRSDEKSDKQATSGVGIPARPSQRQSNNNNSRDSSQISNEPTVTRGGGGGGGHNMQRQQQLQMAMGVNNGQAMLLLNQSSNMSRQDSGVGDSIVHMHTGGSNSNSNAPTPKIPPRRPASVITAVGAGGGTGEAMTPTISAHQHLLQQRQSHFQLQPNTPLSPLDSVAEQIKQVQFDAVTEGEGATSSSSSSEAEATAPPAPAASSSSSSSSQESDERRQSTVAQRIKNRSVTCVPQGFKVDDDDDSAGIHTNAMSPSSSQVRANAGTARPAQATAEGDVIVEFASHN